MANTDDLVNDELQAQMGGTKDRAHGWIGSKFVGIPAANAPKKKPGSLPASGPRPVGSQGKKPGEWIGSKLRRACAGQHGVRPDDKPQRTNTPPRPPHRRLPTAAWLLRRRRAARPRRRRSRPPRPCRAHRERPRQRQVRQRQVRQQRPRQHIRPRRARRTRARSTTNSPTSRNARGPQAARGPRSMRWRRKRLHRPLRPPRRPG